MAEQPTPWQKLKQRWQRAEAAGEEVAVEVRVLYAPDDEREPSGLDVQYRIGERSFTHTFQGIPEGYDAAARPR